MRDRFAGPILALAASLLLFVSNSLARDFAGEITLLSLRGESSNLSEHIQYSDTWIFVISSPDDLAPVQSLLTESVATEQAALALVALPSKRAQKLTLKRAAKSFFTSDFSRDHVYFVEQSDFPHSESKALRFEAKSEIPTQRFSEFPASLATH